MKLLYLSLFLLQISFSLSSLSTFNKVNTNQKTIKISQNFITCLKNSTLPERFLKQIESMNTFPMTIIDDSLLSNSFDKNEIVNIRSTINNCTDYLSINNNSTIAARPTSEAKGPSLSACFPLNLTECLLPHIDIESDKNDLVNSIGDVDWEDNVINVLSKYNTTKMKVCVNYSGCEQFSNYV